MQSDITDSIVSQMCRKFEEHKSTQLEEFKSMLQSTVLTLRQQVDINTAAMVARGVDTTRSTTTESATNPETFTESTESGLEMSEDTDMIIDDHEKDKSPNLLIDGLEETIPKIQKQKTHVTAEITTATHSISVSGAVVSTGKADVDMLPVDVETDQEEAERADEDNDGSINLDTRTKDAHLPRY